MIRHEAAVDPARLGSRSRSARSRASLGRSVEIIDCYAREPGGPERAAHAEARAALAPGCARTPPRSRCSRGEGEPRVGAAVCVWGFSTFTGCPSLNVHDLAGCTGHRGRGSGAAARGDRAARPRARQQQAHARGARAETRARCALYRRFGFGPWDAPTLFVTKPLPGSPHDRTASRSSAATSPRTCARCSRCSHLKGIAYEIDPIVPFFGNDRFSEISPLRRIPVLSDGKVTLCDSDGDLRVPRRPPSRPAVYPREPADRARARWLEEFADTRMGEVIIWRLFNQVAINPRVFGVPTDEAC
jgi:hypothetical protein